LNYIQGSRKYTVLLPIAFLLGMALASVPVVHAYGNAQGTQEWQLTLSTNCNNASLCGGFPGGFWAWAVLYTDGTFDATTTGCGHSGGPVLNFSAPWGGASHCNADGYWNTSYDGIEFFILSETDTCSNSPAHGKPTTTTTDYTQPPYSLPDGMDTGVPLFPGHFSSNPAPGVSTQITVVYLGH
jgi:hypothetical protein